MEARNIAHVIIEASSFEKGSIVIRVPVHSDKQSLLPVRVVNRNVSFFNRSGSAALAEFYRPARKFQRTNFIPDSLAAELRKVGCEPFGETDLTKIKRRYTDIQIDPSGDGTFLLASFVEDGRKLTLLSLTSFDSLQCRATFRRTFHQDRHAWKILGHQNLLEKIELGEIKIDYANRFTRKLVSDDLLPREEQWKKELRHGIQ